MESSLDLPIVLDSSCWIELIKYSEIGVQIIPFVYDLTKIIVPAVVLYEVFKVLCREKGEYFAERTIEYMLKGKVVSLDKDLAIFAVQIGRKHKLAFTDSIIYATAKSENAVLWTADAHFKHITGVKYFDNTK